MKLFVAVLLATAILTQTPKSITGSWDLSADTPHGVMTVGLDVQQDGERATGKLIGLMNRDYLLKGEIKGNHLTMTTEGEEFALALSLQPDGSLSGHFSSPQGDVACKAVRAKKS